MNPIVLAIIPFGAMVAFAFVVFVMIKAFVPAPPIASTAPAAANPQQAADTAAINALSQAMKYREAGIGTALTFHMQAQPTMVRAHQVFAGGGSPLKPEINTFSADPLAATTPDLLVSQGTINPFDNTALAELLKKRKEG